MSELSTRDFGTRDAGRPFDRLRDRNGLTRDEGLCRWPSPSWAAQQIIIFILFLECGVSCPFGNGKANVVETAKKRAFLIVFD